MSGHLAIVAILLCAVSYSDLKERRIPNKFMIAAAIIHVALDVVDGTESRIEYLRPLVVAVSVLAILVLFVDFRRALLTWIGMGDLKLFLYLTLFFFPFIEVEYFFLGLGIISLAIILVAFFRLLLIRGPKGFALKSSVPMAPLCLGASALALIL
jgi:Flp pilus assembly protein protease CpaA